MTLRIVRTILKEALLVYKHEYFAVPLVQSFPYNSVFLLLSH